MGLLNYTTQQLNALLASIAGKELASNKNQANGYAGLNAAARIDQSQGQWMSYASLAAAPIPAAYYALMGNKAAPMYAGGVEYWCDGTNYIKLAPYDIYPYLGQVATRCGTMDSFYAGAWQFCGRTVHKATEDLTRIKVIHPNWVTPSGTGADTASGDTLTLEAVIEYPLNTFTRITYNGANATVIASGSESTPDWVNINIPKGAHFGIRYYGICGAAGGLCATSVNYVPVYATTSSSFTEGQNNVNGGSTPNLLLTTNPVFGAGGIVFRPAAIIGYTTNKSFFILGDSIAAGVKDAEDHAIASGFLERKLSRGIINFARGGENINGLVSGNRATKRVAFAQYCSHVITNYSINDINAGRTAAQIVADLIALKTAYFANKPFYVCTLLPNTTSTDSWATDGANQTVIANNAARLAFNDSVLSGGVTVADGVIDVSTVAQSTYSSSAFKAFGTGMAITADGTHPNHKGNIYLSSNLSIPAELT